MKRLIAVREKLKVCGAIGIATALVAGCSHSGGKKSAQIQGGPCHDSKHAPFITSQPLDTAADSGQQATFSVRAEGKDLSYQWYARKKKSDQFVALSTGTAQDLTFTVTDADFGLYYCAVGGEDDRGYLSISRIASLGGVPSGDKGPFVPIDNPVTAGTVGSICGHTVSGHWDQFPGSEIPPAGKTGVNCQIWNVSASPNVLIPNTDYYLQYWVNAINTGCLTISGDWVTHTVTAGLKYKFIAHFVNPPPDGTVLELQGVWTP